jgi:hypothetical protein
MADGGVGRGRGRPPYKQPGFYDFESEAYLVVSLLTAPEIFREGLPPP